MRIRLSTFGALMVVAGIAVGVSLWMQSSPRLQQRRAAANAVPATPTPSGFVVPSARSPLLDPEPHRAAIEGIEQALWGSLDAGALDMATVQAQALAMKLRRDPGGALAMASVLSFGTTLDGLREGGYATPDGPRARDAWLTARAGAFRPAAWMKDGHSAAPAPASTPGPTAVAVAQVQDWADRLEGLAERAERETAPFGDFFDLPEGSRELDKLVDRWLVWVRAWDQACTAESRPPSAPGLDSPLYLAWQELGRAEQALRVLTVPPGSWPMPSQDGIKRQLETVRWHVAEARGFVP